MKNWKKAFSGEKREKRKEKRGYWPASILLFLVLLFNAGIATSQVEDSKTIREEYSGKQTVALRHAHGPLSVKKSPDGKVYVEASISAKAKDRENLAVLLEHFEITGGGIGPLLEVATDMQIDSWNSNNGVATIKFKDGEKAKGIKDLVLSATLLIPDLNALNLINKYGDINIDTEVSGDLKVDLFSGKLTTNGLCNNLELTIKYGKGHLPNAGEAKVTLFDSDVFIGNLFNADFNSKYSEVEINQVGGNLTIQTFDDKWKVGHIKGDFKFNDKYSEFQFKTFKNAAGSMFDGEIIAASGYELKLENSKYSKYKIKNLSYLESKIAFDDAVEIEKADRVRASDSKYSEYKIGRLSHSISLGQSFDDDIDIDWVAADFSSIHLNGKYSKLEVDIESSAKFWVEVDMKYGKFDHPDFNIQVQKELQNETYLKGSFGTEDENISSSLSVRGFDNTVYWR